MNKNQTTPTTGIEFEIRVAFADYCQEAQENAYDGNGQPERGDLMIVYGEYGIRIAEYDGKGFNSFPFGETWRDPYELQSNLLMAKRVVRRYRTHPALPSQMDKNFLLFGTYAYYPDGGWSDMKGVFSTVDEAKQHWTALIEEYAYDFAEIVEISTLNVVERWTSDDSDSESGWHTAPNNENGQD